MDWTWVYSVCRRLGYTGWRKVGLGGSVPIKWLIERNIFSYTKWRLFADANHRQGKNRSLWTARCCFSWNILSYSKWKTLVKSQVIEKLMVRKLAHSANLCYCSILIKRPCTHRKVTEQLKYVIELVPGTFTCLLLLKVVPNTLRKQPPRGVDIADGKKLVWRYGRILRKRLKNFLYAVAYIHSVWFFFF